MGVAGGAQRRVRGGGEQAVLAACSQGRQLLGARSPAPHIPRFPPCRGCPAPPPPPSAGRLPSGSFSEGGAGSGFRSRASTGTPGRGGEGSGGIPMAGSAGGTMRERAPTDGPSFSPIQGPRTLSGAVLDDDDELVR
jgi:hypothetical protein